MDALINVNGENFQTLQILLLTTLITLLPSIVVMMTSFTRYIISLSFLRSAIGLQQNPPNMVLVGMALFLTLFTMSPVISDIQTNAYEPYIAERITQEEFYEKAKVPLKECWIRRRTALWSCSVSSPERICRPHGHRRRGCLCGSLSHPL